MAVEELRGAMQEMRSYVMNLRPVRLGEHFRATSGIEATVHVDGEPPRAVSDETVVAVFHIAQEGALNNVRKHAGASVVRVTLSALDARGAGPGPAVDVAPR